jgi:hypothetical protein
MGDGRLKLLCEQASHEYDTGKLPKLIDEINALLEKRRGKNEFPESPRLRQNALADEA